MVVSAICAKEGDKTFTRISGAEYRVLEPYCSEPRVAYAAWRVDSAFGDAVMRRDKAVALQARETALQAEIGPESYEVARNESIRSRDQAVVEYRAATQRLLAELGRTDAADSSAPAMAQDLLVLAWRLSEAERHSLLVKSIEVQPAVEAAVVEAIFRCVLEEFALAAPGPQLELLGELLPPNHRRVCSRIEVEARLPSAAPAVWTPDPVLRALDAAELVEAWLAAGSQPGRLNRTDRCYRLLDLSLGCITPELTPHAAPIHRTGDRPLLVASYALFPCVQAVASQLNDPKLQFALSQARATYNIHRLLGQVVERLGRLELIVDEHGREIASLRSAVAGVNARVDALEERVSYVEDRVDVLEDRVAAIERFLSKRIMPEDKSALLRQVAPILLHDDWESGPLMRPRDFAQDADFVFKAGANARIRAEVEGRAGRGFQPAELGAWFQAASPTPPTRWGELTALAEMVPQEVRRRGLGAPDRPLEGARVRQLNAEAIASGSGVFGAVSPLDEEADPLQQRWAVKYFWFNAWNETAFPHGEGNHEGDWGCVDLTVELPFLAGKGADIASARVVDAIFHEHGRPHRFSREDVEFEPQSGRLRVYLERGTNEAHPRAGGAGDYKGIDLNPRFLGLDFDFLDQSYPVIREHRGGGYEYDLRSAVLHLFDEELQRSNLDVQLVVNYHGEWGEYDDDDFKSVPLIGHDVTNPPGPLDNAKFRDRVGVIDHRGRP